MFSPKKFFKEFKHFLPRFLYSSHSWMLWVKTAVITSDSPHSLTPTANGSLACLLFLPSPFPLHLHCPFSPSSGSSVLQKPPSYSPLPPNCCIHCCQISLPKRQSYSGSPVHTWRSVGPGRSRFDKEGEQGGGWREWGCTEGFLNQPAWTM